MRMHREEQHASFLVGHIELGCPHLVDIAWWRIRPRARETVHAEVRVVIENPLHRQLDDAGGLALVQHLVRHVVRHETGVVEQAQLRDQIQRVRAVLPRSGANADRPAPAELLERIERALHEHAFIVPLEARGPLVDPAVDAELVAGGGDALHVLGVELGTDTGNEERRGNVVALEKRQNPR